MVLQSDFSQEKPFLHKCSRFELLYAFLISYYNIWAEKKLLLSKKFFYFKFLLGDQNHWQGKFICLYLSLEKSSMHNCIENKRKYFFSKLWIQYNILLVDARKFFLSLNFVELNVILHTLDIFRVLFYFTLCWETDALVKSNFRLSCNQFTVYE